LDVITSTGLPTDTHVGAARTVTTLADYQRLKGLDADGRRNELWPEYLDGGRSSAYYLRVPLRADWDGTTPLPIDLEPDAKLYRSLPPDRGRKKRVAVGRTPQSSGSTTSAIGADAVDVSRQPSLGCHYIADLLAANEIDVVFGMTGGHAPCTRSQSWHSSRVTGESRDTLGNRTLGRQAGMGTCTRLLKKHAGACACADLHPFWLTSGTCRGAFMCASVSWVY
jgi:hypothetical protein